MQTDYLDVAGKWGIVLCHDLRRLDEYEMRQMMMAFGMRGERIDRAIDVLLFHENTGMCISRPGIRMSLVFIGDADSPEQWWDTLAHEVLDHVKVDIASYYYVPWRSEDSAWLTGYLMRKLVRLYGEPCSEE